MLLKLSLKPGSLLKKLSKRLDSITSSRGCTPTPTSSASCPNLLQENIVPQMSASSPSFPEGSNPAPYISKPLPPVPRKKCPAFPISDSARFSAKRSAPLPTPVTSNEIPVYTFRTSADTIRFCPESSDVQETVCESLPEHDVRVQESETYPETMVTLPLSVCKSEPEEPTSGSVLLPAYTYSGRSSTHRSWQTGLAPPSPPPELDQSQSNRSPSAVYQHEATAELLECGARELDRLTLLLPSLESRILAMDQEVARLRSDNMLLHAHLMLSQDRIAMMEERVTMVEIDREVSAMLLPA